MREKEKEGRREWVLRVKDSEKRECDESEREREKGEKRVYCE